MVADWRQERYDHRCANIGLPWSRKSGLARAYETSTMGHMMALGMFHVRPYDGRGRHLPANVGKVQTEMTWNLGIAIVEFRIRICPYGIHLELSLAWNVHKVFRMHGIGNHRIV